MADAALFGIANSVLQQLASPALAEFRFIRGYKEQFEKIEDTVTTIRNVMQDADHMQANEPAVQGWLARLKDVLYKADDLFDAISAKVLLEKNKKGTGTKVRRVVSKSYRFPFLVKNAHKVKEIRECFDDIVHHIKIYNFLACQPDVVATSRIQREPTHSSVPKSLIVGREQETEDVVRMLLSGSSQEQISRVSVIAVIGIGGLGKTTLAQLVYNDERVQQGFDLCIWACINYFSNLKQVLLTFLKSATMRVPKNLNLDELQSLFRKEIGGKRFLLVLDDVWDEDSQKWGKLKDLLSSGKEGSKVLATTCSTLVARCLCAAKPYFFLGGLSDESAWLLFRKIAFQDEEDGENLELEQLNRLIVKKCANVPLAIVTIANLLRGKKKERWPLVNDVLSKVFNEYYDENIMHTLEISYKELPYPVKCCFGYCSLFPKDFEFEKDSLIHLWIAQGFIEPLLNQRLEDIAEEYFFCLLDRCFFQLTTRDEGKKSVETYQMHDLMHDLAKKVTESESILVDNTDQRSWNETIRHVSINCNWNWKSMVDHVCSFSHSKRLRTFLHPCRDFYNDDALKKLIPCFKSLRVLSFSGIQELPTSVGELIHLRFLDLSDNYMRSLPSSICRLPHLQYLILRRCEREDLEFPKEMEDMLSLGHLDLSENRAISLPKSICRLRHLQSLILREWKALKELPEDLKDLQSLRLLDLSKSYSLKRLPGSICRLRHLESLILRECINLEKLPEEMGDIQSLRLLDLSESYSLERLPSSICKLWRLESLILLECKNLNLKEYLPEELREWLSLRHIVKMPPGLEGLDNLTGSSPPQAMADISIVINKCIQNISKGIDDYIKTETEFYDKIESESIEDVKGYFLSTDPIHYVMGHIDFLDSFFKSHLSPKSRSMKAYFDISREQSLGQFKTVATSSSNVTAPPTISDQFIFDLRCKMRIFTNRAFFLGLMDIQREHHYISVVEDGLELLCNEQPLFKEELRSSMMGAEETKGEPRYLVVSSGCAVCILDLKQSKEEQRADDQVLALPKRATLKLIDKQLPVSVGLFKSGSAVYMTGGHGFSRQEDSENSSSDCKLYYKHLWMKGCFEGTSYATYRLEVKEKDGKMTLFPLKCDNMRLLSPKFWPIVEKIGKELHVFDSTPSNIQAKPDKSWTFSHEVHGRDLDSIIGFPSEKGFIYSHVVVGDRIYALAGKQNMLYENKKWQEHDRVYDRQRSGNAGEVKTVWDILECGNASCVGKAGRSDTEELYVIIAVVRNDLAGILADDDYVFPRTTASYAYLVTLNGEVVCIQVLHHLFLKTKFEPYDMVQGSVIKAGTDGWAVIVIGKALANEKRVDNRDYLFIYMFTVKACIRAVSNYFRKRADKYLEDRDHVMDADFVRVDVKARYIYKTNADFDDDADFAYFVGLRACFLD